jgi:uncharacterized membrane protein YcgQ (UPF0703/DUF1980 family)
MPTLFRFIMILCVAAALVYGAMLALVLLVEPNQTEMRVRVPLETVQDPAR